MSADKCTKEEDAAYETGSAYSDSDDEVEEEEEEYEEEEEEEEDEDEEDEPRWRSAGADGRGRRRDRTTAAAAAATFDLLDARRLPDLLDPARLAAALDECLGSEYVRGCVVETWDAALSDHLEAVAQLVLYQTSEHAVSHAVYEQLIGLSAALRPPASGPARLDAGRVYGTLGSAARSLLATRADACCRQAMCRAVGVAAAALRAGTRPVFSVEDFLVEINEAAHFANLYCAAYARRICAALAGIHDAVMAGDYHPTNVVVQMAVMEKCIRAALRTLADGRATAAEKTAAQRSLLAELDGVRATVRMKDHGCLTRDGHGATAATATAATATATAAVHFTLSPWRAPIRMYHQRSPAGADQLLKNAVRLVETLVSEMFKPCLRLDRRRRGHRHRDGGRPRARRDKRL